MQTDIDPFQLEVIKNCFDTIAEDMALTLMRTSYSGIIRDSMDFSTALCDEEGRTLAQGICTPMHLGSFYDAMCLIIAQYEGRIFPGDVFISNDPYTAEGQHLPDIYIVKPIFWEERVFGWAMTVAHHSDIGGIVAGSNALGATEIFQEGLRLPVLKFTERGIPNQAIWDIIATNVRTPVDVLGDLQAQMAACASGERELQDLFGRYGADTVMRYAEYMHDYAERLARTEIAEIPDGVYEFTDHIDGLGADPVPIVLECKVTIAGDHVTVDWTGSAAQIKGGVNSTYPFTKAAAYTALRSVLSADIPTCHGFHRVIDVIAPPGTVVNPVFPGACGARGITGYRMIDCLMGALSQAVPDKVIADTTGGSTLPTIAGYRDGKAFVFVETFMGTWGASSTHDGQEGVPHLGANQSNVPVEMMEKDYPILVDQYALVPDTGGPGRFRGGLAPMRQYRILADEATLNVRSDKRRFPPHGLFGGKCGAPSMNTLNPGIEDRVLPVLLIEPVLLGKDDVFRHVMAGGGGYGDPLEREPERVLKDVIEEKVTIAHAAEAYGVVIVTGKSPSVDGEATARLRQNLRSGS